mmetsp:Transcript_13061/g.33406  ORF Transcript_13061/g.33406 Transcript_13061/m.33406 type:complete len:115 (+) Transcript_13061:239-583(+)
MSASRTMECRVSFSRRCQGHPKVAASVSQSVNENVPIQPDPYEELYARSTNELVHQPRSPVKAEVPCGPPMLIYFKPTTALWESLHQGDRRVLASVVLKESPEVYDSYGRLQSM